jgi:2-hydroxychromene-2-carboxylate isomerase
MTRTRVTDVKSPIDLYFDFSSPYGYFASEKIEALAAKHGRSVDWHPILLDAVFRLTGANPLTDVPLKGPYAKRDFARSAKFHGVDRFRLLSMFPIAVPRSNRVVVEGARSCPRGRNAARALPRVLRRRRGYFKT